MFKVVTVASGYGSGGGIIARAVAEKLQWNLLDRALVNAAARIAKSMPKPQSGVTSMSTRGGIDSIAAAYGAPPLWQGSLRTMHGYSTRKQWPR